jgi:hypothetical protein
MATQRPWLSTLALPGSEMMKMMSNTSMTSINGVMLISVNDPAASASFMAIEIPPYEGRSGSIPPD